GPPDERTAAAVLGRRVRALRAGVLGRVAPDARRPVRSRPRRGVARDRGSARTVRRAGRLRGTLRAAGRRGNEVSAGAAGSEPPSTDEFRRPGRSTGTYAVEPPTGDPP